jgi:hypothetical protein
MPKLKGGAEDCGEIMSPVIFDEIPSGYHGKTKGKNDTGNF